MLATPTPTPSAPPRLGEADLWRSVAREVGLKERLTPFEFGKRHRFYGKEGRSARWRPEDTPWAEGILWALSEECPQQRVFVPKGTQLGLTEIGLIWTGQGILEGKSTLIIEPSESVAKKVVKTKFRPMLMSASVLAGFFVGRAADTTLHFSCPTVDVIFAGSNSPSNFATVTVPRVMADEFDRWQLETDDEGDSLEIVENRYADYGFLGKLFVPCSPTLEGVGVWREYEQTDQRRFCCPCPACGEKQAWEWEGLKWTPGEPKSVRLACTECGVLSTEAEWKAAWGAGEWRASVANPARTDSLGFHLSSLYGRLGGRTWAELVQRFEAATRSGLQSKLQVFFNTILGLPWKVTEDAVAATELRQRLEEQDRGVVPAGGLILTAGVDYQKNRIEAFIWAWARGRERWLVDRVQIERLTREGKQRPSADLAADLKALALEKDWPHEAGGVRRVEFAMHDSGDQPADVFDVLDHLSPSRNCATKGREGWGEQMLYKPPKIVDVRRDGKVVAHGRRLMIIHTAPAKQAWYDDLRRAAAAEGPSERFVHLPLWVEEDEGLLEQHVAEEVRKTPRGRLAWVKIHDRNEGLDCAILADAARWQLKTHRFSEADWRRREALVTYEPEAVAEPKAPTPKPRPAQQGWLNPPERRWI